MTVESPLYQALRRLRDAQIPAADRELLRPAFAAIEDGKVLLLPDRVVARIRDLDARLKKWK
ncbi:hypothetical protein IAG25_40145 [Caballeronia sp. EK]|uniref:hypothetical protein n=1 Tax=Caballeronia sp. EK TaxID=2767469 RepID=UPI001655F992|nr:hypothetical protein [Caballeronia sp. EK]MBC8642969.1 hypothetical protein [Caballeronia sp. EK]